MSSKFSFYRVLARVNLFVASQKDANQILVGSARCADWTPQRGVPTKEPSKMLLCARPGTLD
jgi:hypothetical protein